MKTAANLLEELFETEPEIDIFDIELALEDEVSVTPAPGRYYPIKKGDNLLTVTGKAYKVGAGGERLQLAQKISRHPLNRKFRVNPSNDFGKKYFPDGIISFNPNFTCGSEQRPARKGEKKCFATIWIPPKEDALHPELGPGISLPASTTLAPALPDLCQIVTNSMSCGIRPLRACFPDQADNRIPVEDTTKLPYKWICEIILLFSDIKRGVNWAFSGGTGFFVSKQHILTSAHVLHRRIEFTAPGNIGIEFTPHAIVILPGRSSTSTESHFFPFAPIFQNNRHAFRVPQEWKEALQGNPKFSDRTRYDYGMISLAGSKLCFPQRAHSPGDFWGKENSGTAIAPQIKGFNLTKLIDMKAYFAGYPGDYPCLQWKTSGKLTELRYGGGQRGRPHYKRTARHDVLEYKINSAQGMSGSPVWGKTKIKARNRATGEEHLVLIGIHSGCGVATAITSFVWEKHLRNWMNEF